MKRNPRIWFNRAGVAKVQFARVLHSNPDKVTVTIHATRPGGEGLALRYADSHADEPDWDTPDEEYATWAVQHAAEHRIDVLIPSCRMGALAARAKDFEAVGCALMAAATPEVSAMLDSKTVTYEYARSLGLQVPDFYKVTSTDQFIDAVTAITATGHTPTVKYNTGWSADSFRIVSMVPLETPDTVTGRPRPIVAALPYARALRALEAQDQMPELIVMPYMAGPEISMDLLSTPDGTLLSAIARVKNPGNVRTFTASDQVYIDSELLARSLDLAYLSNIQFRYLDDRPTLLEINPRPAAGSHQGAHTGVNLHWAAVRMALGEGSGRLGVPDTTVRIHLAETAMRA